MEFHLNDLKNIGMIGAFAGIGMFWTQVKNFFSSIRSFVVVNVVIDGPAAVAFQSYALRNFKISPFGDKNFDSKVRYVRPVESTIVVAFETAGVSHKRLYWYNKCPLFIGGGMAYTSGSPGGQSQIKVTYFKFLFNFEKLLETAIQEHNDLKKPELKQFSRFRINKITGRKKASKNYNNAEPEVSADRPHGLIDNNDFPQGHEKILIWNINDIGEPIPKNPMEALAIPAELQEAVTEFENWVNSEAWFKSKQISWRRGWMLYGKPGTGKSVLVRAIAQNYGIPIYSFDLAMLDNEEMSNSWKRMLQNAPAIALFEDVDCVFDGRENILGEQGGGLTFDCLLNCISGIENADGVFTIMTTNNIDKIDSALGVIDAHGVSSRPGRLDRVIEIKELDINCRRQIVSRILSDWPELIDSYVISTEGFTAAQVVEHCAKIAMKKFWEKKDV